jgi:hypothetical protein
VLFFPISCIFRHPLGVVERSAAHRHDEQLSNTKWVGKAVVTPVTFKVVNFLKRAEDEERSKDELYALFHRGVASVYNGG